MQIRSELRTGLATAMIAALGLILSVSLAVTGRSQDIADLDLENLLDNIVVSASKHAETLEESPANVFIITRSMIDNYGFETIGEALSVVPGIYITDDHSLTQIGVRGISSFGDWNSHVMVLMDGRPLNEQYGGSSSIDLPGVDLDNLDRIEVVKGPASSLYGSNAFLGMINLITRQPEENGAVVSGKLGTGVDNKVTSLKLFHRFNDDLSVFVTGSFANQGGSKLFFEEFSDLSDGTVLSLDDDGLNQYYLDSASFTNGYADKKNLRENFSTHSRINWKGFTATLQYAQLNTGLAHSAWGSLFQRPENQFRERMHYADLAYASQLSDRVMLNTRVSYTYYTWTDYILYNYSSWEADPSYLPGPIWKDWEYDQYVGSEVRFIFDFTPNHKLIVGGETQFHTIRHRSGETEADGETIIWNVIPENNVEQNGQIYNLYAQDEYRFSPKFKAVAGLHFNYYTYTTGKVMPKGALILNPYKNATYKLIVSQGFRSPTFFEMTYDDGMTYYQNPNLEPELITSYELIVSHRFPYGLTVDIAANDSRISNMIQLNYVDTTDPGHPGGDYIDEIYQYRNGGDMSTQSLELSVRSNSVYRLSAFGNITRQRHEMPSNDHAEHAHNSPNWLGNFGLNYQLVEDRFSIATRVHYISSRLLWDDSFLSESVMVDLILRGRNLIDGLDLSVGVKNLFDEDFRAPLSFDYAPSTSIERPGRSLFVKAQLAGGW